MKQIVIILMACLVLSCGARRTQKESFEVVATSSAAGSEQTNAGSVTLKDSLGTKSYVSNMTWDDLRAIFRPVNPDLPMSVTDSKGQTTTFNNAEVDLSKNTGNKTEAQKEQAQVNQVIKDTTYIKRDFAAKEDIKASGSGKVTHKEPALNLNVVFGFVIGFSVLALFLYVLYRIRRNEGKGNQNIAAGNVE